MLEDIYPEIKTVKLTDYKVRVLDSAAGTAAKVRVIVESADDIAFSVVDIEDVIGVNPDFTRVNLQNGKQIHGRQAYPEIFEPFFGMGLVDSKTLLELISAGDSWLGSQSQLCP